MKAKDLCQTMLINGMIWELESNGETTTDAENVVGYMEKLLDLSEVDTETMIEDLDLAQTKDDIWLTVEEMVVKAVNFLDAHGYFAD